MFCIASSYYCIFSLFHVFSTILVNKHDYTEHTSQFPRKSAFGLSIGAAITWLCGAIYRKKWEGHFKTVTSLRWRHFAPMVIARHHICDCHAKPAVSASSEYTDLARRCRRRLGSAGSAKTGATRWRMTSRMTSECDTRHRCCCYRWNDRRPGTDNVEPSSLNLNKRHHHHHHHHHRLC